MQGDQHPSRVALREARHRTIERLSLAFAKDELGLEEFENRVDAAFDCATPGELGRLLSDLEPIAVSTQAVTDVVVAERVEVVATGGSGADLALTSQRPPRLARAILGSVERRGRWSPPRVSEVLAVLGNVELDLREVVLPPGVTELCVRAVLGNVEIVVSPHQAVDSAGESTLGSFSSISRVPADVGDEPILRITGSTLLGNVEIRTLPTARAPALPPRGDAETPK